MPKATRRSALSSLGLSLGRGASALSLNLALAAPVSRHQILARFVGEEAKLTLDGVGMLDGVAHADATLVVDHAVPGGESRELFKTVLDDRARAASSRARSSCARMRRRPTAR